MKKIVIMVVGFALFAAYPGLLPAQVQLDYSTYLGGSNSDYGWGIALGTDGDSYIVGDTWSSDFPTENPYPLYSGGAQDIFISRLGTSGSSIIFSTYLGGSNKDYGHGIALGTIGEVYIVGYTYSTNFPIENPYQAAYGGGYSDAFVSKLGMSGSDLIFSTYLGGSDKDYGHGIALGTIGETYIVGYTYSTNFPTENPYQAAYGGGIDDVFVSKLGMSGSDLIFSTYLGGSRYDEGYAIALGTSGESYITGETSSNDFPTENPYQAFFGGGYRNAFVSKIGTSGSDLIFSTYLGGASGDRGLGIVLGTGGQSYLVGETCSPNFPTKNPYQISYAGAFGDAFVSKIGTSGSDLIFSTYLGGNDSDSGFGIALGAGGEAYVTGITASTNFPTKNPYQAVISKRIIGIDVFISKLGTSGSDLIFSTYLGGSDVDGGRGIALSSGGEVYVTGETISTDFPTKNPYQSAYGSGYSDVFVSKLTFQPPPLYFSIDSGDYNGDGTSDIAIFRESSGLWAVRGVTRVYFGGSADETVPGDYDGDGTTDIGIFRGSSGLWALRGVSRVYFGSSSDLPHPGDYDGDGTADIAIFRGASGLWAIHGVTRVYFGGATDEPVPGYYNGDGTKDIGIFRPASGLWVLRGISRIYFGGSTDEPVPGDYDGNGSWDVAIFRSSSGLWAIRALTRVYFGSSIDQPVPADYDGLGDDDIGIYRGSSGLWAVRGVTRVYFGGSGDIPVTR